MAALIQYDDAPVANNPQVLYMGGNGGGHAFSELILDTTTVIPNNPQRLYVGGVGGGHSFSALLLDTSEVVLQNPQRLYAGGIGGGHAFGLFLLDTVEVVIQNPQKLYLGGIGGGYALAQTYQDTNMVVPQNPQLLYRGGIGGGHDLDTSTEALVVKDCISPSKPVAQSLTLCAGAVFSGIQVPELTGHFIRWYSSANGGTATLTPPAVSTSTPGVFRIYATYVNDSSTCESGRTAMEITISAKPTSPVVSNVGYCIGATASVLTATATAGHTLKWYADATTSTALAAAPVPSTSQAGTTVFYVSQVNTATGCESDRSVITVTVSGKPLAPVVANISYCQGATASALTATATVGHTLKWYADATTSTALAAAPVPSTSLAGTAAFYVSQVNTTTGCESDRVAIIVTVNATQPPVVAAATWCQQAVSTALTATVASGHRLNWYGNSATGGSGSNTAPVPSTSVIGTFDFYVSQTNLASGCESMRSKLTVTIYPTPERPVVTRDANASLVSSVKTGLQWLKDQVVINGAVDSIFKPSVSGNYSVRHTQNGCTVFSQDYYYMTTALVNLNNDEYIEIFPNPFQSYLQINFKLNRLKKPNLKVYEASGKLIYEETQVMPGVKLNTSGWINGSYRIVISTGTGLILYTGSVVK